MSFFKKIVENNKKVWYTLSITRFSDAKKGSSLKQMKIIYIMGNTSSV